MEKPIKVKLHIISPVHVGCDDVYEPTSFRIDSDKKKLVAFNPVDFVKALSEEKKEELVKICDEGGVVSIQNLYNFVAKHAVAGREVDIASDLISHHQTVCRTQENKLQQELNKFQIFRTVYNPNNAQPYIPGSSLKGAIRTAYLSKLAVDKGIKGCKSNFKNAAKNLEIDLLGGSFATDPFRMVKISDFLTAGNVKTKIVYAVNKKKKTSKYEARGPFQILEIIKENTSFDGIINIYQPLEKAGITSPVNEKILLESVHSFYHKLMQEENAILKETKINTNLKETLSKVENYLGKLVFLVRVGRHSGAESVTVEGNRDIKIMQRQGNFPEFRDHATTVWLASDYSKPSTNTNLMPFGWALLEIISEDKSSIVEPLLNATKKSTIVEKTKPSFPSKSEFESFSEQISKLNLSGKDWGRVSVLVDQIKKIRDPSEQKKSTELLLSKIKQERKSKKDYEQKTWFVELEKLT